MRKPLIITTAALVAALAAFGGVALADETPSPVSAPKVSLDQAVKTALGTVAGGWVESADFDRDGDRQVWEIDVITADGAERELAVDAATGKVLSANDTDGDDDSDDDDQDD
ncbi:PepSY domain-containing protein [Streptosporangium sp. KLBMP 9127]|nr:PepSY domain-containing protein [Streptosporangium sp. KLBMP 9127]